MTDDADDHANNKDSMEPLTTDGHEQQYDSDDEVSVDSNDTLHEFIDFKSHRNSDGLEEAISFTYPMKNNDNSERLTLSTLLEEDDLAPLFDGAGWAGTRVWSAAIWGIQYLVNHYGLDEETDNDVQVEEDHKKRKGIFINDDGKRRPLNLCELGCGLGVPGMVWHLYGGDAVLTDQPKIMSQLKANVKSNFPSSFLNLDDNVKTESLEENSCSIQAQPLDWSREGFHDLLQKSGFQNGFDIVLNCDCVYEPLYGKSWGLLVSVIDECLKVNPKCVVVTSVERRVADGIDSFVERMTNSEFVSNVDKVLVNKERDLELYITTGNG